eukprot:TRINITY_DN24685_c0_g1_i1.p1 TRINITY_DN24685_c0_g1~~TRINITY_DN24685_c0_g1_i1.p1  ORF type:complete len:1134 (+),score=191.05 TRINITY_DN24685_c0_g1_i1:191-3592(+)
MQPMQPRVLWPEEERPVPQRRLCFVMPRQGAAAGKSSRQRARQSYMFLEEGCLKVGSQRWSRRFSADALYLTPRDFAADLQRWRAGGWASQGGMTTEHRALALLAFGEGCMETCVACVAELLPKPGGTGGPAPLIRGFVMEDSGRSAKDLWRPEVRVAADEWDALVSKRCGSQEAAVALKKALQGVPAALLQVAWPHKARLTWALRRNLSRETGSWAPEPDLWLLGCISGDLDSHDLQTLEELSGQSSCVAPEPVRDPPQSVPAQQSSASTRPAQQHASLGCRSVGQSCRQSGKNVSQSHTAGPCRLEKKPVITDPAHEQSHTAGSCRLGRKPVITEPAHGQMPSEDVDALRHAKDEDVRVLETRAPKCGRVQRQGGKDSARMERIIAREASQQLEAERLDAERQHRLQQQDVERWRSVAAREVLRDIMVQSLPSDSDEPRHPSSPLIAPRLLGATVESARYPEKEKEGEESPNSAAQRRRAEWREIRSRRQESQRLEQEIRRLASECHFKLPSALLQRSEERQYTPAQSQTSVDGATERMKQPSSFAAVADPLQHEFPDAQLLPEPPASDLPPAPCLPETTSSRELQHKLLREEKHAVLNVCPQKAPESSSTYLLQQPVSASPARSLREVWPLYEEQNLSKFELEVQRLSDVVSETSLEGGDFWDLPHDLKQKIKIAEQLEAQRRRTGRADTVRKQAPGPAPDSETEHCELEESYSRETELPQVTQLFELEHLGTESREAERSTNLWQEPERSRGGHDGRIDKMEPQDTVRQETKRLDAPRAHAEQQEPEYIAAKWNSTERRARGQTQMQQENSQGAERLGADQEQAERKGVIQFESEPQASHKTKAEQFGNRPQDSRMDVDGLQCHQLETHFSDTQNNASIETLRLDVPKFEAQSHRAIDQDGNARQHGVQGGEHKSQKSWLSEEASKLSDLPSSHSSSCSDPEGVLAMLESVDVQPKAAEQLPEQDEASSEGDERARLCRANAHNVEVTNLSDSGSSSEEETESVGFHACRTKLTFSDNDSRANSKETGKSSSSDASSEHETKLTETQVTVKKPLSPSSSASSSERQLTNIQLRDENPVRSFAGSSFSAHETRLANSQARDQKPVGPPSDSSSECSSGSVGDLLETLGIE